MSDQVDVNLVAVGGESVDRVTSSLDRMITALERLGDNTAVTQLAQQMEVMQATMVTGFASLAATMEKSLGGLGTRQAQVIEENGTKAAAALESANMKTQMAQERAIDRQLNTDNAFNNARMGMLESAHDREIALQNAFDRARDGIAQKAHDSRVLDFDRESRVEIEWVAMLEAATEKKLALESVFDRARAEIAERAAAERVIDFDRETKIEADWVAMLEAATEKKLSLEAVFARTQAEMAQQAGAARALDFDRESKIETEWVAMLEAATEKKLALESAFARTQAEMAQQATAARILDFDRESKIETEWVAMLEAATERKLALESVFARTQAEMAQQAAAARIMDFDRESKIETEWIAMLTAANEKKLALEAAFNRAQASTAAKQAAQDAAAQERQRSLNASYLTASPATQVRLSSQAQLYGEMGGDAAAKYGTAAAAADALTQAEHRLAAALSATKSAAQQAAEALERQRVLNTNFQTASPASQVHTARQAQIYGQMGGDAEAKYGSQAAAANALSVAEARLATTSREAAAAHIEMSAVLNQAEGAFRGAAHQAGIYGMHHGQLIGLLAGGALAAGLHHIAETGSEVEFQLASLNALGDKTKQNPIDFDAFIGITSGTMTGLKDAAEGVHALAQAGQSQAAAFAALPDIMRLAQLGEMSVAQASELAVESMHAFGKSITDVGAIGDILVAVGSQANVSVHKLAEDMKSAATTGETFGMTMQEITAAVGTLAERGLTIQPLSSAMMKLYEPSDKTAKVMKQLGIEVKNSETNGFRPFKDILEDLSHTLDGYSNKADVLKGMGFSSRDMKAVEAMTQHIEDFEHLLESADHAQGKMFDATVVKMDTAEGAWKRLGSAVEGSFTKAFEEASPVIRMVENDLMHMASSSGVVSSLENLAVGVARLTKTFVENIGVVATLVASYGAMRMLSSLTLLVSNFTAAKARQAVVAAEAATANAVETTTLGALTVAETAAATGATALAAASEVAATGMRLLTAAAGWIGVAILAATAAYELLSGKMSEADKEHLKQKNTYDTTSDAIQQEIERLKGLEKQLMLTGTTGVAAAAMVHLAFAQMKETAARGNLEAAEESQTPSNELGLPGRFGRSAKNGAQLKDDNVSKMRKELEAAQGEVVKAKNAVAELETLQEHVEVLTSVSKVKKEIKDLPKAVEPANNTDAARQAADLANEGLRALRGTEVTEANVLEVEKQRAEVAKDVALAQKRFEKPEKGSTDAAKTEIEALREKLRLKQMDVKNDVDELKSQNKRGELGDLQLINRELEKKHEINATAVTLAERELAVARAGGLKPQQLQKYENAASTARKQDDVDGNAAARARAESIDKMDTAELQARAKTLTAQGQLQDAFNIEWEMKYRGTLDKLDLDIEDADNEKYRKGLERYKEFLNKLHEEGEKDAAFKMDENYFNADLAKLKAKLGALRNQDGPGAGLRANLASAFDSRDLIQSSLPQLKEDHAVMVADAGDDPAKLKAADAALKHIQDQTAVLNSTFIGLGETITKSLTEAFGKSGAAMGGLITTAIAYDAKMKDIQTTLDNSDGGNDAKQKAAKDTASTQIHAYGDMAAAAQGFFKTSNAGYKVMHDVSAAFRMIEMAETAALTAKKIFFKSGEVAAHNALNVEKMVGEAAATVASVANAAFEATAWGAAAVIKAIASLPFPANLAAGAVTLAAVVAMGAKLTSSGAGGSTISQDRQASNGTGSILGDSITKPSMKSDSIAKSLASIEKNTYDGLAVSQGMLSALQTISSGIKGLDNSLYRAGFSTEAPGTQKGAFNQFMGSTTGTLLTGGPFVEILNKLSGGWVANATSKITNALFGGNVHTLDTGISLNKSSLGQIARDGAQISSYANIKTDGGLFHSDKESTKLTGMGADVNSEFSKILGGMSSAITQAAGILGLSGDAFTTQLNSFVVDLGKISTKDMKPAEVEAALQAALSKVGDDMAAFAVADIKKFQNAGEGALETLTRIANEYQTVDAVFSSLGTTFGTVGMSSMAARENLIDMAGGLEKFTSKAEYFLKNLMSPAQQAQAAHSQIDGTLGKYGLTTAGPDAVQKFTALTLAMGTMGDAGAQAYTDLMNIAPAFKEITDATQQLQDQIDELMLSQAQKDAAARAKLDPANQGLFDQLQQAKAVASAKSLIVSAYERESQAMQSAVDKLKAFSLSLHAFVNSLQLGNLSPLNPADRYGAAMAQFNDTLAKAKTGDTAAQSNLQAAAQAFLQASRDANASNSTYQADYQRVVSSSDQLAQWADKQVTEGQANLIELRNQVSQLVELNTGVLSVVDAINNLAVVFGHGTDDKANSLAVETLYQEVLGRASDKAGLDYWTNVIKNGASLSFVADNMKNSDEYNQHVNTTPATNNVTPSTQYGVAAQLDQLYQQLLGRNPDQAGMDYWMDQIANGVPMSTVTSDFENSPEHADYIRSQTRASADPYVATTQQNELLAKNLADMAAQLIMLREEQQKQADQQVIATMAAGAGTGEQVATAITTAKNASRWEQDNTMDIR